MREESRQAGHFAESIPYTGKTALGFRQQMPGPIEHFNAQRARVRMIFEKLKTFDKTIFSYQRIGIQKQQILTMGLPNSEVVGPGKAKIDRRWHPAHAWKGLEDHISGIVDRGIVNYDHFTVYALQSAHHGMQTLLEKMPNVVIDDDDAQCHPRPLTVIG